jgi:hypothetical protein
VQPSSDASKNVEGIKSSFDTELFVTEVEQLPTIWDSISSSNSSKQGKYLCFGDSGQEID